MQNNYKEPTLLTTQNLPEYQLQLTKIGVPKTQFDLSSYIGQPTHQIQDVINALKLAHLSHKYK